MMKKSWLPIFITGVALLCCWMIYRARRRRDHLLVPLASAMQHMKSGDLILFSGRHIAPGTPRDMLRRALFLGATYTYRAVDNCEYGHVAVVYRNKQTGILYLLHCEMSSSEPDVLSGEPATGVQMTILENKLRSYKGYCVWQSINKEIPEDLMFEFLRRTYHMNYRVPGDVYMRLLDRILKAPRVRSYDDTGEIWTMPGMLCTEWVGAFYEYCGVFDPEKAPYKTYYLPSDFMYVVP